MNVNVFFDQVFNLRKDMLFLDWITALHYSRTKHINVFAFTFAGFNYDIKFELFHIIQCHWNTEQDDEYLLG